MSLNLSSPAHPTAVNAKIIYHEDGLEETFRVARLLLDKPNQPHTHLATLPEIIALRLARPATNPIWTNYYLTASAEFFGVDPTDGEFKFVIIHGQANPLATPEMIRMSYDVEDMYASPHFGNRYGTLPTATFRRLLLGEYGSVTVVTLEEVLEFEQANPDFDMRQIGDTEVEESGIHPLLRARFGPRTGMLLVTLTAAEFREIYATHRATSEYYAQVVLEYLRSYTHSLAGSSFATLYLKRHPDFYEHFCFAQPLVVSQLMRYRHGPDSCRLGFESTTYQRGNGSRVLVLDRPFTGNEPFMVSYGLQSVRDSYEAHLSELTRPNAEYDQPVFGRLLRIGRDKTYLAKPHEGSSLGSSQPQYRMHNPVLLETKTVEVPITGYYGFLNHELSFIREQGPAEACAYDFEEVNVGDVDHDRNVQVVRVNYYKGDVDTFHTFVPYEYFKENLEGFLVS